MAEILNTLKSYIKVKEIDEDNLTFKLFYRVSVGLCMLGVVLVAATQYIGSPIQCNIHDDSVDLGMFQAHCWIHGTYHIPLDILSKESCIPRETIKVKFSKHWLSCANIGLWNPIIQFFREITEI